MLMLSRTRFLESGSRFRIIRLEVVINKVVWTRRVESIVIIKKDLSLKSVNFGKDDTTFGKTG